MLETTKSNVVYFCAVCLMGIGLGLMWAEFSAVLSAQTETNQSITVDTVEFEQLQVEVPAQRIYPAVVTRVIDGDTYDIDVDLGFGLRLERRFRAASYDAPETYFPTNLEEKKHGISATERATKLLLNKNVHIQSAEKMGKYGRWICEIILPDGELYSEYMKKNGFEKQPTYR